MKKILFLQLLAILILVSCSIKTQPTTSEKIVFQYEKTSCMGPCPVYTFILFQNGVAQIDGAENISPIGSYKIELSESKKNEILELINSSNLTQYNQEYRGQTTDLPTTKIRFLSNGEQHKIIDYSNAPIELKAFEKQIEKVILSIAWE